MKKTLLLRSASVLTLVFVPLATPVLGEYSLLSYCVEQQIITDISYIFIILRKTKKTKTDKGSGL